MESARSRTDGVFRVADPRKTAPDLGSETDTFLTYPDLHECYVHKLAFALKFVRAPPPATGRTALEWSHDSVAIRHVMERLGAPVDPRPSDVADLGENHDPYACVWQSMKMANWYLSLNAERRAGSGLPELSGDLTGYLVSKADREEAEGILYELAKIGDLGFYLLVLAFAQLARLFAEKGDAEEEAEADAEAYMHRLFNQMIALPVITEDGAARYYSGDHTFPFSGGAYINMGDGIPMYDEVDYAILCMFGQPAPPPAERGHVRPPPLQPPYLALGAESLSANIHLPYLAEHVVHIARNAYRYIAFAPKGRDRQRALRPMKTRALFLHKEAVQGQRVLREGHSRVQDHPYFVVEAETFHPRLYALYERSAPVAVGRMNTRWPLWQLPAGDVLPGNEVRREADRALWEEIQHRLAAHSEKTLATARADPGRVRRRDAYDAVSADVDMSFGQFLRKLREQVRVRNMFY